MQVHTDKNANMNATSDGEDSASNSKGLIKDLYSHAKPGANVADNDTVEGASITGGKE